MNTKKIAKLLLGLAHSFDTNDPDTTNHRADTLRQIANEIEPQPEPQPEPEPEPKSLLADAKVGDLCKRSNGRYTQFYSKRKLKDGSIAYYFTDASGSTDIDGNHCIHECGNNIVSCEPLATEGTAEWAWQILMLGKSVYNPAECYNPSLGVITPDMVNCQKDDWVEFQMESGWQLYEPEPQPEPAFKVGDWVEYTVNGNTFSSKIYGLPYDTITVVASRKMGLPSVENILTKQITRKLDPSEVIVKIGCLSGTVEKAQDYAYFLLWHSKTDCDYSMIKWSALDAPTRSLVEHLLKAQEEKC